MKNTIPSFITGKRKRIIEIIASFFILLFVYTALTKLFESKRFAATLSRSPLLTHYYQFIAIALPLTELAIATLLFIQKTRRWGLYASLGLMTIFTGYLIYMLSSNLKLPCSCGGVIAKMTWQQHLVFNIACIVLALAGIYLTTRRFNQHSNPISQVAFTYVSFSFV